jgi:hypothetical protein
MSSSSKDSALEDISSEDVSSAGMVKVVAGGSIILPEL